MAANNFLQYNMLRESEDKYRSDYMRKFHVTKSFIRRLGLETELEGHNGCVNCLEWNESGGVLASGSDDLQIILWDPFTRTRLANIQSGHNGNIFSLKFLPNSNDRRIISAAADFRVRLYDVCSRETLLNCCCHWGRIKRLATTAFAPSLFWSAAEDGMILQFDLRENHRCSTSLNNVLINLANNVGRMAEAKCIAVNPVMPELVAVGANDPYVRLYDRRMIRLTTVKCSRDRNREATWEQQIYVDNDPIEHGEDNLPPGCVSYFVAGHLPLKHHQDYKKRYRCLTSTYIAFSPNGKEILTNLGGEQIYLFNLLSKRKLLKVVTSNLYPDTPENINQLVDYSKPGCSQLLPKNSSKSKVKTDANYAEELDFPELSPNRKQLPQPSCPKFQSLKQKANEAFVRGEHTLAINMYSNMILHYSKTACLYCNRAAAYMNRAWNGDYYAAVRDCYKAIQLDPEYLKAYFRLSQCFYKLNWCKIAMDCLNCMKERFPNYSKTGVFAELEKTIKLALCEDPGERDKKSKTLYDEVDEVCRLFLESERSSDSDSSDTASAAASKSKRQLIEPSNVFPEKEQYWRKNSFDYEARFCGHCNTTTDIKEANFFGSDGQFIVAGSDDGSIFIWDRVTTNIERVLRGDDSIVNCLQPHPSTCLLATSGIDPVVRLWGPKAEDGSSDDREVTNSEGAAVANQRRMNADPLEVMLINMGYRLPNIIEQFSGNVGTPERHTVNCPTS